MIIKLPGCTATKHLGQLNYAYNISVDTSPGVYVSVSEYTVDFESASSTTVTGKVTVGSSYTLSSVVIKMGGTDITSSCYNSSTGAISITGITGNVVIKATATSNSGSGDSGDNGSGDSGNTDTNTIFDYDFTTNTIDDYALEGVFTIPSNSTTSAIEYDATKGMSLNDNLPNGLNLVNPIDASKAWSLEFEALFVTPTVLAGNRRAFLGGANLTPFVFINGGTFETLGFQISSGSHMYVGTGKLKYDAMATYKITHDGNKGITLYIDGVEIGTTTVNFADSEFTVILGNVSGKSSAYVWKNVEDGKKSYLKKIKFTYTE